jgi:hypothetical protein
VVWTGDGESFWVMIGLAVLYSFCNREGQVLPFSCIIVTESRNPRDLSELII